MLDTLSLDRGVNQQSDSDGTDEQCSDVLPTTPSEEAAEVWAEMVSAFIFR